jgi:flavin reductase (DIM6/NTAB) family NADH-FMN oxidoreductase RutF
MGWSDNRVVGKIQQQFNAQDISSMDAPYRALFINSLGGFKSANLVGTKDQDSGSNVAIMSSAVHIGANPPLLAIVIRPDGGHRHTLKNILQYQCFTLNHINEEILFSAHQTAARYADDVSEFAAVGLTHLWQDGFDAPFVAESSIRMGLEFRQHIPLDINGTHFVIGEIVNVSVPKAAIQTDGAVMLEHANSVALAGLDAYHSTQLLGRMAYPKTALKPDWLKS